MYYNGKAETFALLAFNGIMIFLIVMAFVHDSNVGIDVGNAEVNNIGVVEEQNYFDFVYVTDLIRERDEKRLNDYCKGRHCFKGTVVDKRGSKQRFVEWNFDRRYDYIIDIHPEGTDSWIEYMVYVSQSVYDSLQIGNEFVGYGTANPVFDSNVVADCNHLFG